MEAWKRLRHSSGEFKFGHTGFRPTDVTVQGYRKSRFIDFAIVALFTARKAQFLNIITAVFTLFTFELQYSDADTVGS